MNFYCTLFNIKYFSRGLAMCQSLLEKDKQAYVYILAIDKITAQILTHYNLPNTKVILLDQFEDEALRSIKSDRTLGEYCWTITPSLILYCLKKYALPQVCYVDADLYFYHNPAILIQEAETHHKAILLSPHRYTPKYDQSQTSGIYCVQFMNFVNNLDGLDALIWWREACIKWCYNRIEPNRFGDQKYLDDWPERFKSVHVLKHLGGGVAPWNVQKYQFSSQHQHNFQMQTNQNQIFELVFYHFHGVKFLSNDQVDFGGYMLESSIKNKLYLPYVKKILAIDAEMIKEKWMTQKSYATQVLDQEKFSFKIIVHFFSRKLNKTYNRISV